MRDWVWLYKNKNARPAHCGWFATVNMWEPEEGGSVGVELFEFYEELPPHVIAFYGPFPSLAAAEEWAYGNDPNL